MSESCVALVTGASKGVGRGIAIRLAEAGWDVAINFNSDQAGAEETAERIRAHGQEAILLQGDVGYSDQVNAMFETLGSKRDRLRLLVNNAGVGFHRLFVDTTLEDWNRVIGVNLTGSFLTAQAATKEMIKNHSGKIINIGSISGQRGGTGRAAYGASKAGLMQLTRVMSVELAPLGIAVNAIAPGPIQTPLTNHGPEQKKAYLDRIPARTYGDTDAITAAAIFLASKEAQFIHGTTLNVDGGFNAAGLIFSTDEMLSYESGPADSWSKPS